MILLKAQSAWRILIVALACLVLGGALFGLGYWQGERAMRKQVNALATRGINPGPGNNFARFGPRPGMPFVSQANIPANASPEMKEFLQNRQTLMEKMAELRQQNPNGAPNPQLFAEFRQQNADLFKRQSQLAQIIGQQQARNPLPEPPPLQIPPNASPQLKAYLTARDQLMRDQVAFMNQHRTDAPAARQSAMQQWRQENATRFQQLQQLAQAMAQAASAATTAPK